MRVPMQFGRTNWLNKRPKVNSSRFSHPIPFRRTHCQLWICFFVWEQLEGTVADAICPAPLHQPPNCPPKTALPYTCITGYATTLPWEDSRYTKVPMPYSFDTESDRAKSHHHQSPNKSTGQVAEK